MTTMLAIETSVPSASVALWHKGSLIFQDHFTTDRRHNSMVFDPLQQALKRLDGAKLDLVIAGTGPGSYSGTRVGIAAVQGIAIAHACPAVGIGSLAATPEAQDEGAAIAIGDARRGLFYLSEIQPSGEASEARLMPAEAFHEALQAAPASRLLTCDPIEKFPLPAELIQRLTQVHPKAEYLGIIWNQLTPARQQELMRTPLAPAYLRPPFTSKAKPGHPLLRSPD